MGLDVTAYETVGPRVEVGEDEDFEGIHIYNPDHFPGATRCELARGRYESRGTVFGFRAGSYSGYNRWREQLASLVGTSPEALWANHTEGPFAELINFSDCEGALHGAVARKLRDDFIAWQERAEAFNATLSATDLGWFIERYNDWRKAFELAADAGAVCLH